MSPAGAEAAPDAAPLPGPAAGSPRPLFGGCWSCRLLSGAGLLMAAVWVYQGPRRAMRKGVPPSMGAIAQITFAAGLAGWAIVILADPVGRRPRREP
ncbi:distal membrane-arm assembly complex protein 1 isoform X2 [Passer montanus]|uniref:distal membrane-arm assembly complex protein 1 isoform X2 n=1 Tax=Passer montanus TaxID=9160 RepID=UPI001961B738|nr:distal membrane-arm assembly complex protein 1 isoform X2 [Passer montanus]